MRTRNEEQYQAKRTAMMEKAFACYAEHGLNGVGIRGLGQACGCKSASLYEYFEDLDDLILSATAHCMEKVVNDYRDRVPSNPKDLGRFLEEMPYWMAEKYGKTLRLMYQVYTHPKYLEAGRKFFADLNVRYTAYAKTLEKKIGIPYTVITPQIFAFVRLSVHYAMFGNEEELQARMAVLKQSTGLLVDKYRIPLEAS